MAHSRYLSSLTADARAALERKLFDRQSGVCFICDESIDFVLHKGQLDIDHIDPVAKDGLDAENNFALTHASCNRSKGAANLEVARRLAEFEKLQLLAKSDGKRGANLGDVLAQHQGAKAALPLKVRDGRVEFCFACRTSSGIASATSSRTSRLCPAGSIRSSPPSSSARRRTSTSGIGSSRQGRARTASRCWPRPLISPG